MSQRPKTGWQRRCGACGSEKLDQRQGMFRCLECGQSEMEDPWRECPCCGSKIYQTKTLKVGAYITGAAKCSSCDYRITFESRVTHQQMPGERQPGPYRWMSKLMGRTPKD